MGDYQIDRITEIILMCKNKDSESCAVTYDVEGNSATASVSVCGALTPELTVTAKVGTMTIKMFEQEDVDVSAEELDSFLEQFIKE